MTRTPGVPGMPLPPREPIRVETEHRSLSPPPASLPPAGEVQLRGNGWRLNLPAAVVLAALSAIGARYLPTQTATDAKLDDDRSERRLEALRNAEFREEMRAEIRALRAELARSTDDARNRFVTLEARLERLEKRPP